MSDDDIQEPFTYQLHITAIPKEDGVHLRVEALPQSLAADTIIDLLLRAARFVERQVAANVTDATRIKMDLQRKGIIVP